MTEIPYLHDLVILFGSALLVITTSHFVKIPATVGFLLTGVIVGPHGLGLITESSHVEVFAELGVVFLLFVIGLEVSIEHLKKLRRFIIIGGGIQALSTSGLTTVIFCLLGFAFSKSLYFGFLVTMSSTAVVLKIYADREELTAPHGQLSVGILLFQDILIVPLLLLVPILAGNIAPTFDRLVVHFGGGLLFVFIVFIIGRFLMPHMFHVIVGTGIRELFVICGLFSCLGVALLTESIGFSLAFGGFLAGILLSESDYRHQLLAEMSSIRDVFTSMFFISIGMLLSLEFASNNIVTIVCIVFSITSIKIFTTMLSTSSLSFPVRTAIVTSLGLAQIGEFSFVLIRSGYTNNLIDDNIYQLAIASSVATMLLAPLLITLAPRLVDRLSGFLTWVEPENKDLKKSGSCQFANHVIIAGFGLNGRHLARVLRSAQQQYVIVDLDAQILRSAQLQDEPIHFGDITRKEILEECGIRQSAMITYAISDPEALRLSIRMARQLSPETYIVARTRELTEIEGLQQLGANEVVAQEFETSIEMVTIMLTRLHLPGNIIRAQSKLLRADGYQMLREQAPSGGISEKVVRALASGTTDSFLLSSEHCAVGQSIRSLDLRKNTGASIIALVRGEKSMTNPAASIELRDGDVIILVGSHPEIESAFIFLERTNDRQS